MPTAGFGLIRMIIGSNNRDSKGYEDGKDCCKDCCGNNMDGVSIVDDGTSTLAARTPTAATLLPGYIMAMP